MSAALEKKYEKLSRKLFRKLYKANIQDGTIKIQMVYPISNCDDKNCVEPVLTNFNGKLKIGL